MVGYGADVLVDPLCWRIVDPGVAYAVRMIGRHAVRQALPVPVHLFSSLSGGGVLLFG